MGRVVSDGWIQNTKRYLRDQEAIIRHSYTGATWDTSELLKIIGLLLQEVDAAWERIEELESD